jgi:NAD-dependent deacetylase
MEIPGALVEALRGARRVMAMTGAGVSAESGVPTFRQAQTGLWARFRPEDLATPEAFQSDPRRVWEWYAWRRGLLAGVEPNAGHGALAALERRVPVFNLVTQNVDGLHQRAGSRAVLELHGNIARTKCFAEGVVVDAWSETGEVPPRCPRCGGLLRPDVVWFGESLPEGVFEEAARAASACDVFLCVGTSSVVHPAAELPRWAVREGGAMLVEVNPEPTPLSGEAQVVLRGKAGEVLPALVAALGWSQP